MRLLTSTQPLKAALIAFALSSVPAFADTFTFTATGTQGGTFQNGKATFVTGTNSINITLENTAGVGQLSTVGSVLDGISFTLAGGPATNVTLASVSASGFVDCVSTASCIADAAFHTWKQAPKGGGLVVDQTLTSPYNWTLASANPYNLFAGAGSFKPAGIVNNNVTPAASIPNGPHNDYLMGPVTFTLNFTPGTTPLRVTAATLYFGTGPFTVAGTCTTGNCSPNTTASPVPEPSGVLLLGGVLAVTAGALRRRRTGQRNQ